MASLSAWERGNAGILSLPWRIIFAISPSVMLRRRAELTREGARSVPRASAPWQRVQTFVNCFGTSCVCGFGRWLFAPCDQAGKVAATPTNGKGRRFPGDGHAVVDLTTG